jgi:hypothetical protein
MVHVPETHARSPIVVVHVPPGIGSPSGTLGWQMPGPERLSHQSPLPHSASVVQLDPHPPVAMLQNGPGCVPVVHIVSVVHIVHAPVPSQYGLPEGHAFVAVVPLSPLQGTHVLVALQSGVVPVHAVVFAGVHCTHWLVVESQAGVGAAQFTSVAHVSQSPEFGPEATQTPAMHCVVVVQVPSPSSIPHTPPFASQTPVWQTRAPFAGVHCPPIGTTVGKSVPFGSLGVHALELHQSAIGQSVSSAQPNTIVSIAIAFAGSGFMVVAVAVTVAVPAPGVAGAVTSTTMGALAPLGNAASVQVTVGATNVHDHPAPVALWNVSPAGIVRTTVTPLASLGPLFVTPTL